jgi:hypothetical protein
MEKSNRSEKYWQAAADCIELARNAHDEKTRAGALALAQKWLDAESHRPDARGFLAAQKEFNDRQMKPR